MKKKVIITTLIIVTIILVLILGIILINNYLKDDDLSDDNLDTPSYGMDFEFNLSKEEVVLCKGKEGIAIDYYVSDNVEYTLTVVSSDVNICSVNNLVINPINIGYCQVEYTCIFDSENIFIDYLFVTVIDYIETINTEINSLAINVFDIKITTDKIPQENCLSVLCDESVVVSDMKYENNVFNLRITTLRYKEDIIIKYKNISDNFNNEFTTSLELLEDVSYVEYTTNIEPDNINDYYIYLYNLNYSNEASLDSITNVLTFTITEGVHSDAIYKLISDNNVVIINNLSVIANNEGETNISLYCNDRLVDTINIIMEKVIPTNVIFVDDLVLNVKETISVEPFNITPVYCIYNIDYTIVSGSECIEMDNGLITAIKAGTCKLIIIVNDFSKQILITIPESLSYEMTLLDVNYNPINDTIFLSEGNNFIFYTINTNGLPNINIKVIKNSDNLSVELYSDYLIINAVEIGEYVIDFCIEESNTLIRSIALIKT